MRKRHVFCGFCFTTLWLAMSIQLAGCGSDVPDAHSNQVIVEQSDKQQIDKQQIDKQQSDKQQVDQQQADKQMERNSEDQLVFPDSAELEFKQVEMSALVEAKVEEEWIQTGIVSFGSIYNEPVVLEVYKVPEGQMCGFDYERVVLLTHMNKTYRYQECFSERVENEYHDHHHKQHEQDEQQKSVVGLSFKQKEPEARFIVHGVAELAANGPGRMAYFYYDREQGRWYGFEDWGYPQVADLDGDGDEELVNQFPGLHLHGPDLTIYRWGDEGLSAAVSIKAALHVPISAYSGAKLNNQTHTIEVTAAQKLEQELFTTVAYKYDRGKLLRIKHKVN